MVKYLKKLMLFSFVLFAAFILQACADQQDSNEQNLNGNGNKAADQEEADDADDRVLIVDASGNGDFTSVQEAVKTVELFNKEPVTIYVRNGTYYEQVLIIQQNVRLIGEDREETVIVYDESAPNGGRPSVTIKGDYFYAENITFENSADPKNGQALAAEVTSRHAVFNNVRLIGNQDTLFANADGSRQYYKNCYIEGTTDFIYGSATAVFDECVLHSKKASYITAASTPESRPYGYVFLNNKLTYDPDVVPEKSVYLGRPWRPFASVIFIHTEMDAHIKPEGWHNWDNPENEKTARYFEYGSTGPGAAAIDQRVDWSHQLSAKQAAELTIEHVLGGEDQWNPLEMIAQAEQDRERLLQIVSK